MDLDDILNSALDEVTGDEETTTNDVKSELSSAAASTAKVQDENAAAAAASEPAAAGDGSEIEKLLKMLDGAGDLDKVLDEAFKDLNLEEFMQKLGGEGGDDELANLMKMFGGPPGPDGKVAEPDPKLMEEFASKLESSMGGDEMNKMLENMMKQVMSKEVMYEPIKAITEEYPKFLSQKGIPAEDRARYENQFAAYKALRTVFEQEGENPDKVVQIMQDLEKYGQAPDEIMKHLTPPGVPGGMPNPNGCPQQ